MTDRPDAYVRKEPGDPIRSGDWNELQIRAREELLNHRHTGKDQGVPIARLGIEPNAIDGSRIDPAAEVTVKTLTTGGDATVCGDLRVKGKLLPDNAEDFTVPKGGIIMWSGNVPPPGWALCDGSNGTPDLRGRFVLGAGSGGGLTKRNKGEIGGVERHGLKIEEMPNHNHAVYDPGHYHNWSASRQMAGTDDHNNSTEFSRGDKGTIHGVSINTDRRHTGINIHAAGGGAAHENMPPFYVLAYIIKL